MTNLKNIAIIAHVDHGKTTMIDSMLRQSGVFRDNQQFQERLMDSNDLEKERGITILAKCTSVAWKDTKINIIDTPGHADFGGEVERVLSMADGVLLLVDAAEGPMPQTKFVLGKALALGLCPIVVINKIDRPDRREEEVIDEIFDLFVDLNANEDQLDFPIFYASGRDGWCVSDLNDPQENLDALFDGIIKYVPDAKSPIGEPFKFLVSILDYDPFLGRILTGKIYSGQAKVNMPVKALNLNGEQIENARLTKLFTFKGNERVPIEEANAGDIISIAGMQEATVADTINDVSVSEPIKSTPIDPPTMSITIGINDSPYAGTEGKKLTSRVIRDRLLLEAESNVAISVTETENKDAFEVGGRGELQLGVLVETMRREGFELSVSRPKVLFKTCEETGQKTEPIEELVCDVDDDYTGVVVEKLNLRKGEMQDMKPCGQGKTRITFLIPSRGLIGYMSEFLTDTRGTGTMNRLFHSYAPYKGFIGGRRNGVLISNAKGDAVAYALWNLQERGILFVKPQDKVYDGMIVGENSRDNDLEVNVLKGKQLTNVRASGTDEMIRLSPPRELSLEQMIAYIDDDELLEVTPENLRLRKKALDASERRKISRDKKKQKEV